MKRCPISLVSREMQIRAMMRQAYSAIRLAETKILNIVEGLGKEHFIHCIYIDPKFLEIILALFVKNHKDLHLLSQ